MNNIVEIEVINWERYNPRSDRKTHTWFRLENNIATEPKFHGLTSGQKFIAVCLLAEGAKGSGRAKIVISWICDQLKVKVSDVSKVITQLIDTGVIRFPSVTTTTPPDTTATPPDTDVTPVDTNIDHNIFQRGLRTDERTNERTNDRRASAPDFDFESLYQKYPRKIGKQDGLKRCRAQIKSEEDYRLLSTAIDHYRNYIRTQGFEEKFIKHFSSFMSSWRDWLDPGAGKSIVNQPLHPVRDLSPPVPIETPDRATVSQILGRFSMRQMPTESA